MCSCQTVKTKEEKEVLEHFAGMVCLYVCVMHAYSICSCDFNTIHYYVCS